MAHEVSVNFQTKLVANKDIEIKIKSSNGKLGTLLISKGNIEWLPKSKSVNRRRLSWSKFADHMSNYGKPIKKKKAKRG